MKEKKKESEKLDYDNFKHLKVFGIALITISFILVVLVSFVIVLSYTNFTEKENDGDNGKKLELTVTQEENVIINVVELSSPSVVSIAISRLALRTGEGLVDEVTSIGTGFVVDSNGIIVTNQHVVSDITAVYKVVTSDEREFEVVEILRDDLNDIALLKVDATSLKPIELGDSDALLVGQTVIAIGTPLGRFAGSVTTGVISGLNRSVSTSSGWFGSTTKVYEDVIQTDAAVNPGNSGGPLISTEGKVIGVNFATTSSAENISFALPINRVRQRIEEYRTYGKFIRPYIGISYRMISPLEAMYYEDVVAGALVVSIDSSGPASEAGIKRGDIIVKIEGKEVDQSFANLIQTFSVGQEIDVELWTEGESRVVKVTLKEAD